MLFIKIIDFLLSIVLNLFCMLCILRIYMQMAKVSFANPVGQGVIKLTNWLVLPLQKLLPHFRHFDLPSFIAAYLCSFTHLFLLALLKLLLIESVHGADLFSVRGMVFITSWSMLNLVRLTVYVISALIFIRVILSWVQPNSPALWFMQRFVHEMSAPLLKPIQKILPNTGGLDFSPFIVLLLLQVVFNHHQTLHVI